MNLANYMQPSDLAWAARVVADAQQRFPRICPNGRNWYSPDRPEDWHDHDLAMVCLCRVYFLKASATKTARIGSYGLKHCIERHFTVEGQKSYVHNGACIVAAMALGFPVQAVQLDDLNCRIGISTRSISHLGSFTEEVIELAAVRS